MSVVCGALGMLSLASLVITSFATTFTAANNSSPTGTICSSGKRNPYSPEKKSIQNVLCVDFWQLFSHITTDDTKYQ